MTRQILQPSAIALAVAGLFHPAFAQQTVTTPTIEVIGTTPLPGIGVARDLLPSNVQSQDSAQLADPRAANLPDLLNRQMGSVFINEVQGNPLQPDVNFRGFTASPLLGTPQGMSVYLDGVRLNQPFGDVVSWDLIPRSALASMNLMPGSNPLFGLNTLGGAIVLQTKDGASHPGAAVQGLIGTYGRKELEFEHGGKNDKGLHWYMTGHGFKEDGWRDDSPSDLGQFFGKLGWSGGTTDISLSGAVARSKLTGNGMQDQRFWEQDRSSVYTKPDETRNRSTFFNLVAKHGINDDLLVSGNAYYRKIRTSTFNADVNEDSLDQSVYQPNAAERAALKAAGYSGYPTSGANASNTPFPYWRCIANVLRNDEPAEKCNGLINRTETTQENYGLAGQLTYFGKLGGMNNQLVGGAAYDTSRMRFRQSAQFGYLNSDHSVTPVDFYADGTEIGDDGNPVDARVDLKGRSETWSVFASDTLSLTERLHLNLAGRYNTTSVRNRDQLNPGGGSGSLDGDHRFSRFNPAVGVVYQALPALSVYGGYNEGSRTPTAIELGCADPANPCKLPNAMAGDPPLRQVVTHTWEAGLRGALGAKGSWRAGLFRAENDDDILFVANSAAGYGYFRNFGKTRRQGVELGANGELGLLRWSADYTYLDATFQSSETLNGAANSAQDSSGNIVIKPGDRLPMTPNHLLKLRTEWQVTGAASVSFGMLAVSGSKARGNENGQHETDGVYYLGSGKASGYAIFDLGGRYKATSQLSFFTQVNNLFDRKYVTAAQLGATAFTANGSYVARPFSSAGDNSTVLNSTFVAPGAPRTAWVGFRYEFGDK